MVRLKYPLKEQRNESADVGKTISALFFYFIGEKQNEKFADTGHFRFCAIN